MTTYRYGDRMLGMDDNGNVVDCGPAPDFHDPVEVRKRTIATLRAGLRIAEMVAASSTRTDGERMLARANAKVCRERLAALS